MRFVEVVYEEKLVYMLQTPLSSCAQNYRLLWCVCVCVGGGGGGGGGRGKGTFCPRADCPGGGGGTSCTRADCPGGHFGGGDNLHYYNGSDTKL